jgi:type VI secretion system protein ImpG
MRDELLEYYERELIYLRHMGAGFAAKYPKIAGRLLLESGKCEDPHVERLLEAFAFLAARVHLKVDDEFPAIVQALFQILYPHYLRPLPSMSVAEFHLDPEQGKLTSGHHVPRHATLYSRPVDGSPCKFRTCRDLTLWPVTVRAAQWRTPDQLKLPGRTGGAVAALRLELECLPDVAFRELDLPSLRFFLSGDGNLTNSLIELLCNNCLEVVIRDPDKPSAAVTLPGSRIRQVGFDEDDAMLPYPRRSFAGFRLLQEYFAFPEKFSFLELSGLEALAAAGMGRRAEAVFLIGPHERAERRQVLELGVTARTFRLGCCPVVNLFEQASEPIAIDHKSHEYRIVADARREHATDIFSVNQVTGVVPGIPDAVHYEPMYSFRHGEMTDKATAFWFTSRQPSAWRTDKGSDVYVTLADLSGHTAEPGVTTLTARLTCSNGMLPARLAFGNEDGDFQLEDGGPITRIIALVKPTTPLQPPSDRGLLWRLASQLSLNYLSLVGEGIDPLREILKVHDFSDSQHAGRQIAGIIGLKSKPHWTRVTSDYGVNFARGTRVELELDEENFAGMGVYTFSAMLERFLGLYVSINSFSQLVVRTRQRKGILKEWAPRAGERILI